MKIRIVLAIVAVAIVVFATVQIWDRLRAHERDQIARIAESESYAARSRLVRNIDLMLRALRDVHIYWSTFGHLPRDQWADDASIELAHLAGVELILWHDPSRSLRFARNPAHSVFDYRPGEREWAQYGGFLEKAVQLSGEHILGPFETAGGDILFEVYFVPRGRRIDGTLVAVINTQKALDHLLREDSPGFAITVKARDKVIYRRGVPGSSLPESWTRSGFIQNSVGTVWEVIHAPSDELAENMDTRSIDAVLYSGLTIAALIGLLLIETGRASDREKAAMSAKAELAKLNLELEEQVAERTQELEERSRDLVTITDSVSHDLRNPLNAVSANVQLLQQLYASQLGEKGTEIAARMESGIGQMAEILDRLLSLSVVSSARFEREPLNLTELAQEIFEELQVTEQGAPVEFQAQDVPEAKGEPIMVHTLLMNLLSNALKFTRTKPQRRVTFASQMVNGVSAYYVQDNGVGFSPEKAEELFRAFERLPGKKLNEGLGLGLNIASRVVRRHGGRIWAESEEGEGATFYFTLGEDDPVD